MIEFSWILFIIQLVSSWMMIGVAWLLQVTHYSLIRDLPEEAFFDYQQSYVHRSQWLIVPLMIVEMGSAFLLMLWPIEQVSYGLYVLNFALIALIWVQTIVLHLPTHRYLQTQYSLEHIHRLSAINWLRTLTWTLHGIVLILILY
ncbi:MAG: hypothetical protein ACSNEK_00150 [Parachlamydiaceae bacterium]